MITDLDILRAASTLIQQHGEDAAIEAAQRADSFLEQGNTDGVRLWKAVMKAVEELQRDQPNQGEMRH